jgi:hypothetical protein
MKSFKPYLWIFQFVFIAFWLTGCVVTGTDTDIVVESTFTPTSIDELRPGVTETLVQETSLSAENLPTQTQTLEATATDTPPVPDVKTGLEATNPAEVQLASGKVQLVEFFAFW